MLGDRLSLMLFVSLCKNVFKSSCSFRSAANALFLFPILKTISAFIPCVLRSLQEMLILTIYLLVILAQALAGPCSPNKAGKIT